MSLSRPTWSRLASSSLTLAMSMFGTQLSFFPILRTGRVESGPLSGRGRDEKCRREEFSILLAETTSNHTELHNDNYEIAIPLSLIYNLSTSLIHSYKIDIWKSYHRKECLHHQLPKSTARIPPRRCVYLAVKHHLTSPHRGQWTEIIL